MSAARRLRPGITPARAGKRGTALNGYASFRDHPRACGEKFPSVVATAPESGSPPRVRGKVTGFTCFEAKAGITPARAGKRQRCNRIYHASWDHPRACGEKQFQHLHEAMYQGSPPRVRGKVPCPPFRVCPPGITPARAGKRMLIHFRALQWWDHPRACGEKEDIIRRRLGAKGSPPRVRGKELRERPAQNQLGITPARAGKSIPFAKNTKQSRDHPRACGEKT